MKHRMPLILAIIALTLFASEASAQGVKVEVRGNAESAPVRAEARQAEAVERRMEVQSNAAKRQAANRARVFAATIERLEGIIVRLESRIEKFDAEGGVVADAKLRLVESKHHVTNAKVSLRNFSSVDLNGERAQENFAQVRELAAEVKMHIREVHTSLMRAVSSLKMSAGAEASVQ
jgi:hypothetical protein